MLQILKSLQKKMAGWWKIPTSAVPLNDDVRLTFAARQRDIFLKAHESCVNHTTQVSLWMISTLLVLNSGALAAIFSSETIHKNALCASEFFVAGICFAMLNGWLVQAANLSSVRHCVRGIVYWDTIASGCVQNLHFEEEMNRSAIRRIRLANFAQGPGWLSMVCFLGGIWELARFFPG